MREVEDAEKQVQIHPKSLEAHQNLVRWYVRMGLISKAKAHINKMFELKILEYPLEKLRIKERRGSTCLIIGNDKFSLLFSYETPVAGHITGMGYFRTDTYHSRTTSKHINAWLIEERDNIEDVRELPQETLDNMLRMELSTIIN